MNWLKGAKWRKWDLHVHNPASHNFAGDWNQFIIQLGNADCDVIGINDSTDVALVQTSTPLAGHAFTNADCAVIPYILRLELLKLGAMWQREPAVADWWTRVRDRPSVKAAIFDRMLETDWAPFRNMSPDPWPKVQNLLKAA